MSDQIMPNESSSANDAVEIVEALEREIAAFRRLREGLASGESEKPADEIAGSAQALV